MLCTFVRPPAYLAQASSVAMSTRSSVYDMFGVLLLLGIYGAATSTVIVSGAITPSPSVHGVNAWAFETFLDVRDPNGEIALVELRQHCCDSLEDVTSAFCHEFRVPLEDCGRLGEFLLIEGPKNQTECQCEPQMKSKKLGTLSVNIFRADVDRTESIRLSVHTGDLEMLETRVESICTRFHLSPEACDDIQGFIEKEVLELEITEAKESLSLLASERGYEGFVTAIATMQSAIAHLERVNTELRRQLVQKANAHSRLYWHSIENKHKMERDLRRCTKTQSTNTSLSRQSPGRTVRLSLVSSPDGSGKPQVKVARSFLLHTMRIPRVHFANLSYAKYLEAARRSEPIILQGFSTTQGRPGLPSWSLDHIRDVCGNITVPLKKAPSSTDKNTTNEVGGRMWAGIKQVTEAPLHEFLRDFTSPESLAGWPSSYADLYLHDVSIPSFCPELLENFVVPRFFASDKLQLLAKSTQKDYWPSLFIGGEATASAMHADWAKTAAWMGLLAGRKHWLIAKPSAKAALYERIPTAYAPAEGRFRADLLGKHSDMEKLWRDDEVYEDVLEAGEVLFIPADCPHQVKNLEKTIAVAANFVDDANLPAFTEYLEHWRDFTVQERYRVNGEMLETLQASSPVEKPRDLSFYEFKTQWH